MRLLLAPLLLLAATPVMADQRIEMIDYSANRVYTVVGQRSIQTTIELRISRWVMLRPGR